MNVEYRPLYNYMAAYEYDPYEGTLCFMLDDAEAQAIENDAEYCVVSIRTAYDD